MQGLRFNRSIKSTDFLKLSILSASRYFKQINFQNKVRLVLLTKIENRFCFIFR
jgi:hypothetical protein